ncbi:hypothetical protein BGZ73_005769 [Actinomortierella ambigua]|nr:hypothetical protein BGZ73_005769 [Actinomortierella ambigua]
MPPRKSKSSVLDGHSSQDFDNSRSSSTPSTGASQSQADKPDLNGHERATTPPRIGRSPGPRDTFNPLNIMDDSMDNGNILFDDMDAGFPLSQQSIGSSGFHSQQQGDEAFGVFGINSSPSGETLRRLTLSPRKRSPSSRAKRRRDAQTLVPGTPSKAVSAVGQVNDGSMGVDNTPLERPTSSFMSRLALATVEDTDGEEGATKTVTPVYESSGDSDPPRRIPQPKARPVKRRTSPKKEVKAPSPTPLAGDNAVVYGSDSGSETEWQDKEVTLLKDLEDSSSSELDEPLNDPFSSEENVSDKDLVKQLLPPTPKPKSPSSFTSLLPDDFDDLSDDDLPPLPQELRSRSGRVIRSTVTPSTTFRGAASRTPLKPAKKMTFSLKLVAKDKARRATGDFDLSRHIQDAMGDNMLEESDPDEEEEILFGTEKIVPKDILSEEQTEVLQEVLADEAAEFVEDAFDFFTQWPQQRTLPHLDATLCRISSPSPLTDRIVQSLTVPGMYKTLLLSPFMHVLLRSEWEMPRVLYTWLVDLMALESDFSIVNAASVLLQHAARRPLGFMVMQSGDLARICRYYGAMEDVMEPRWKIAPVTAETKPQRVLKSRSPPFPKENLLRVINLVHECALTRPSSYSCEDIRTMVNIMLRIVTDPIVGDTKTSIMTAIGSLLDAIPETVREDQRILLVQETIHIFGDSLPFMLLILSYWPGTNPWTMLIRRSIAVAYLGLTPIPPGSNKPVLEEITSFVQGSPVFGRHDKADYRRMTNTVKMLGYCLDDDALIATYNHKELAGLILILRQLHGKIIDVRAAFLDRTHAKDALQRLFTRLFYAGVHRTGPTQSTLSFSHQPISYSGRETE